MLPNQPSGSGVSPAEIPLPRPRRTLMELRILQVVFGLVALHAVYAFTVGFDHNISDRFGFRQAQTALATRSLLEGSPWFAYQIPIFGSPWGLPIEFPLYQWITAMLVVVTGMPLIAAGRIVSIVFFLTCVVAIWKILGFFRVEPLGRYIILSLLLVSPIYLFWSRTFLIQTCALSLCLWFTLFALRAAADLRYTNLAIATVLGMLGAVVKITTLLPFWLMVAAWLAVRYGKRFMSLRAAIALAAFLLFLPVLSALAWSRFVDSVLAQNELPASFLLSSELYGWIFGTIPGHVSADLWGQVSSRILPQILGATALFFCLLVLLPLAGQYSRHVAASAALFFVPILAFPVLHQVHEYYQTENALFLLVAAGFLVYGMSRGSESYRIGAYSIFGVLLLTCVYRYYDSYFPVLKAVNTSLAGTVQEVQRHAKPDQLIVINGLDWNPELPFYSHRRAIMDRVSFTPAQLQHSIRAASPASVGDVLYCLDGRKEQDGLDLSQRIARIRERYGLETTNISDDGTCIHYFNAGTVINVTDLPLIGTIDAPGENESAKGSILVAGWAMCGQPLKKITISIDGQEVASGGLTISRSDVVRTYPQYSGGPLSGYSVQVDISRLHPGRHTLGAAAVLPDGSVRAVGKRTVIVIP